MNCVLAQGLAWKIGSGPEKAWGPPRGGLGYLLGMGRGPIYLKSRVGRPPPPQVCWAGGPHGARDGGLRGKADRSLGGGGIQASAGRGAVGLCRKGRFRGGAPTNSEEQPRKSGKLAELGHGGGMAGAQDGGGVPAPSGVWSPISLLLSPGGVEEGREAGTEVRGWGGSWCSSGFSHS